MIGGVGEGLVRAGIIGTGFIGTVHARAARRAGARIAGVVASTPEHTERAVAALGAERGFADATQLAESDEIDVVHVCTPNDLHRPQVEAALAAGKHVVCEKPLAVDLAGATALRRAAEVAGVVATVPFVYRFYPMVREARARVDLDGAAGTADPRRLPPGLALDARRRQLARRRRCGRPLARVRRHRIALV